MIVREHSYFGRAGDFMTVRHLVVRGSNFDIGHALGRIAVERYGRTPETLGAPAMYVRARRSHAQRNYPILWQRMRGVAAAFEIDAEDDRYDLTALPLHLDLPPGFGCSVVYYPPSVTTTGTGYLSRNYDFYTGALADLFGVPRPSDAPPAAPVMSEPYIMQWYPDDGGYASIAIQSFDLMNGTLDGLNAAGLTVSILADDESFRTLGPQWEPHPGAQRAVGLHELQVMRLLLDTCANVDQAKATLLDVKQYYRMIPCRYIVADRDGRCFIYENSTGRNVQHLIDGRPGAPLPVTNFQLCKHPDGEPTGAGPVTMDNEFFWRYQVLCEAVSRPGERFSPERIAAINDSVATERGIAVLAGDPGHAAATAQQVPARTLWHALYDQARRTLDVRFYLGDEDLPDGTHRERRSAPVRFALDASA